MPTPRKKTLPKLTLKLDESIGTRIKRFRKLRAKTQEELAQMVGISRGALESYEAGRNHLNDETLIHIAVALKISLDKLVGLKKFNFEESDTLPNIRLIKRMNEIQKLSITDQKVIIRTIDTFLKGAKS